jgi:anti-sigma B factor antagonist
MSAEQSSDNVARLAIDGEMTIYRAADLKQELVQAVRKNAVLEVDLAGISELDTAGLQVLMVAKQAAAAAGHQLHLVAHSAAVIEIFEMLDVGAFFGDALLMPAAAH